MKINNNIKVENLAIRYDVAAQGTEAFEAALEDGTILGLIQANADEATGGDIIPVVNQLLRNLSSKRTNDRKRTLVTTGDKRVMDMAAKYDEWLHARKGEAQKTKLTVSGGEVKRVRPWHSFSRDEIEAMDLESLRKLKNSYASYQSKEKHSSSDPAYGEKDRIHDANYLWLCDLYSKRAKEAKAAETLGITTETKAAPKVEVTPELLQKLIDASAAGKKVTLGKDHVAELTELLKQITG